MTKSVLECIQEVEGDHVWTKCDCGECETPCDKLVYIEKPANNCRLVVVDVKTDKCTTCGKLCHY